MIRSEEEIIKKMAEIRKIANNPKKYGFIKSGQAKTQIDLLKWMLCGE